jgi:RsiW-degrading membrane proteinase PrsW (M82 family)
VGYVHNTTFAIALFLVIGLIAPFIEEVFKPMAVWISKGKSLKPSEGFALGLISGGAFTLLESAGLVIQITAQDWISAVLLRAATGMLHIGMSGLVGYGIVKARSEHKWGTAILYTLGATALHGLWNSMAIINGYYSTPLTGSVGLSFSFLSILSVAVMVLDFMPC